MAAEKIENIYGNSQFVLSSFVYGDSLQSKLVAIVVPDPDFLVSWASKPQNKVTHVDVNGDINKYKCTIAIVKSIHCSRLSCAIN